MRSKYFSGPSSHVKYNPGRTNLNTLSAKRFRDLGNVHTNGKKKSIKSKCKLASRSS